MIGPPPRDIKPAALFRILLRGERALSFRLHCAPRIALSVRAPAMLDAAEIVGLARAADPETWLDGALLAAVLWTSRGRAFLSSEEAAALTEAEASALSSEVWRALAICAPTYAGSDVKQWERVILEGAHAPENYATMAHLGRAGGPESARPDTWFGRPVSVLSDGQLMVANVCRNVYIDRVNSERRRK